MNYEQANSVKHLAPEVYEVMKRLEWVEYLKEQKGGIVHQYSWQPQVGEWCIYTPEPLVKKEWHNLVGLIYTIKAEFLGVVSKDKEFGDFPSLFIPIPEWETIEGALRKAEYKLNLSNDSVELYGCSVWCVYQKSCKAIGDGDTRQEAVYRAVIALGKELNVK